MLQLHTSMCASAISLSIARSAQASQAPNAPEAWLDSASVWVSVGCATPLAGGEAALLAIMMEVGKAIDDEFNHADTIWFPSLAMDSTSTRNVVS